MNEENVFPVDGDTRSIEQVDRIQTYLDNKAIDLLGYIAGSLDGVQQWLTTAAGTILKNLHNRLKKDLQRQSRIISKFQKKLDYAAIDTQALAESDKQEIDRLLDDAPIEIDQFDSGTVPSNLAGNMPVGAAIDDAAVANGAAGSVTVPVLRTNPDTCEYERQLPDGTWLPVGSYDQQCLANKNNPTPVNGGGGNNGGGTGGVGNTGDIGSSCQYPAYISFCNPFITTQMEVNQFNLLLKSIGHDNIGVYFDRDANTVYTQYGADIQQPQVFSNYQSVVMIPQSRNSQSSMNPWTEEAENLINEMYPASDYYADLNDSPDVNTYAAAHSHDTGLKAVEFEYELGSMPPVTS